MTFIPHFVQIELDAGDSAANRLSAFNFCNGFDHVLPFHDGTVSSLDRQHLWGLYSGIAAGAAVPVKKTTGSMLAAKHVRRLMRRGR